MSKIDHKELISRGFHLTINEAQLLHGKVGEIAQRGMEGLNEIYPEQSAKDNPLKEYYVELVKQNQSLRREKNSLIQENIDYQLHLKELQTENDQLCKDKLELELKIMVLELKLEQFTKEENPQKQIIIESDKSENNQDDSLNLTEKPKRTYTRKQ